MRYRVRGVDRQNGREVRPLIVEADTEDAALAEASRRGMLVHGVEQLPPADPLFSQSGQRQSAPVIPQSSQSKYPALDALSTSYIVVAFIICIAAIGGVWAGFEMNATHPTSGMPVIILSIIFGVLSVITSLACAEGIRLMVDVEETLRQIRDRLPKN
jgi:hypothetical protein